jgi:hypothetical protein
MGSEEREVSMPTKNAFKKIGFVEEDEGFIKKLAKAIGCYYSKANERTYNLNRFASDIPSKMGVFAWVHKDGNECFWVSTRKTWVEEARTKAMAARKTLGTNCFTRDTQQADDSVSFDTQDDYEKTVSVLTLVKKLV